MSCLGETVDVTQLKQSLTLWLTEKCDFYFLCADVLRAMPKGRLLAMQRLQDLLRDHKELVTMKTVTFRDACERIGLFAKTATFYLLHTRF